MATRTQSRTSPHTGGAGDAELKLIPIDKIDLNPDNPRIVFRQGELEQLIESIRLYDVQVPIAVYKSGSRYVLIDGQRRWMASAKLNRPDIPALIQEKPDPLTNLLLMFNIHALREQWDLLTIALKLPKIIELLKQKNNGQEPKDKELAEATGLPGAWIRRSKLLLNLPERYRDMLLVELQKPKSQQTISEDLFIEMERALNVLQKKMPGIVTNREQARRVLLAKYRAGKIGNIVQFRDLSKIARAKQVDADEDLARNAIEHLFSDKDYTITQAFRDSVADAYLERDIATRVQSLLSKLRQIEPDEVDDGLRNDLRELIQLAQELLESE